MKFVLQNFYNFRVKFLSNSYSAENEFLVKIRYTFSCNGDIIFLFYRNPDQGIFIGSTSSLWKG